MRNNLSRRLFYAFPPALRYWIRRLFFVPLDLWEGWTGRRGPMVPPRGLIFTGGGDFVREGERLLAYCRELGGLQPHHQVLDIGSGMGRAARALTGFLSEKGRYEGFDVVERGVRWCNRQIASRFPNFHFHYVPLKNDLYRSDGKAASQFEFPFPSRSFDFVIVNSVFTHLLPDEVRNYLHEISRVLQPGGRVYATFFLLDAEARTYMGQNQDFRFEHDFGHYHLMHPKVQAANVAFEMDWLEKELHSAGLTIHFQLPGFWSGRPKGHYPSYQDLLILHKES